MTRPVHVLGGAQTDFARNWTREGLGLVDLLHEATDAALVDAGIEPADIDVVHVANFVSELFTGQSHLAGLVTEAQPTWAGRPISRHEAACASGSVATLAAMADLEAGRYDVACVVGVELMRNVSGVEAGANLGAAAWVPHETEGVEYPWPQAFSDLGDEYDRRYGLDSTHLQTLARSNFDQARRNPCAQTRSWEFTDESFTDDDDANPVVTGRIRRQDCSQITDGSAAVVLVAGDAAARLAERSGRSVDDLASIEGWGHRTARMAMAAKLEASREDTHVFPHVRGAVTDAWGRAGIDGPDAVDCLETHDCFTTTHYMAIDHYGLTEPGDNWQAIEDGSVLAGGRLPINPSGGLMGVGHPVGASGVRMLVDASRQVTDTAGDVQVDGARRAATLNIGGNATTTVSFVVSAGS